MTDFEELVARMRHAQKEYFRTHSETALEEAKRLERTVDAALLKTKQPNLFKPTEKDIPF